MMRASGAGARRAALLAVIAAVVAVIIVISSSGGKDGHKVSVVVADAANVIPGQFIKAAGVNVGRVDSIEAVDRGRAAKLTLSIDDKAWPLPQGTKLQLRWGGTVAFVNRYVLLTRGPSTNPPIASNGVLPAADFSTPVEFDSFVGTFDKKTRADLKTFLGNAGIALHTASPNLRRAIDAAPAALAQTADVLGDLDSSESTLSTLVRSGAQVVDAVHRADPGIQPLLTGAATTFAALASRAQQLGATLQTAPRAFAQTRATLAAAEPTLNLAQSVTARVAPGVTQLRRIAAPLDSLLTTLRSVGPDAITALGAARAATPSLNPLLVKAATLMPTVGSIGSQGTTSLQCVRPYTPDIVAFTSDWGDFISGVDGKDHYFRAQVQTLLPATYNAQLYNSAQMKKVFPWISYAYPPPPGYAAGQPWFLPQCNEGPSTLNPAADPENNGTLAQLPAAGATPISGATPSTGAAR
jgi:virulence factor Mce-like protein